MARGYACIQRLIGLFLALTLAVVAAPVAAHSELRGSVPVAGEELACAPDQMVLEFNEGVQLTALRLYRGEGEEIALPRRAIREADREAIALPPLEPGDYRAEWRIISADGHTVGGVIPFRVLADCPE